MFNVSSYMLELIDSIKESLSTYEIKLINTKQMKNRCKVKKLLKACKNTAEELEMLKEKITTFRLSENELCNADDYISAYCTEVKSIISNNDLEEIFQKDINLWENKIHNRMIVGSSEHHYDIKHSFETDMLLFSSRNESKIYIEHPQNILNHIIGFLWYLRCNYDFNYTDFMAKFKPIYKRLKNNTDFITCIMKENSSDKENIENIELISYTISELKNDFDLLNKDLCNEIEQLDNQKCKLCIKQEFDAMHAELSKINYERLLKLYSDVNNKTHFFEMDKLFTYAILYSFEVNNESKNTEPAALERYEMNYNIFQIILKNLENVSYSTTHSELFHSIKRNLSDEIYLQKDYFTKEMYKKYYAYFIDLSMYL